MKRALVGLMACVFALPALAQDASRDWDMLQDERKKMLVAYTRFDNGVAISTRCVDGGFEAIVTGLPPAGQASTRSLSIAFGEEALAPTQWTVAIDDTVAVADLPAPFARRLRAGGRLRLLVPNGAADGRNLMYDLQLPVSAGSIDQTLTTCGRPLVDPRDAELDALPENGMPADMRWSVLPTARFPRTFYARGFAAITCVTNPDGTVRDCVIESEHPRDGGFGEAALAATRRARVERLDRPGAPVPIRRIGYKTRFVVNGYQTIEDAQRARDLARQNREQRAAERPATQRPGP